MGDPIYAFHPVRIMGKAIGKGESFLRARIRDEKKAGMVLAFSVPACVFILSGILIAVLTFVHPFLGFAASVFGIYSSLSIRDLQQEAQKVLRDLENNHLEIARQDVARIVGRDTAHLNESEVIRAAIEAVSESTVDGIIAPLFYAALGGAPLALAYKAVNTLDSMIGHQNERYQHFGFFAAKQDEFWNWIPARLSWFFTAAAVFITRGRAREALQTGWSDGVAVPRGNSAIPEASFAGALGVRLGGTAAYQGRLVEKPFLGKAEKDLDVLDLKKSIQLMLAVSWVTLAAMIVLHSGLGGI